MLPLLAVLGVSALAWVVIILLIIVIAKAVT